MTPVSRARREGPADRGAVSVVANPGPIVRSPSDANHVSVAATYRPDVDGLRAIAALAVVLAHAGWLPLGGYGVDVFFVISGFLITGIIWRSIRGDTFSIADFYARRIKRIFPALLALLIAVGIAGPLLLAPDARRGLAADIVAGALFSENFLMYFTLPERSRLSDHVLGHLWTLGIEEQYYLLWPLTLWCAWRLNLRVLPTHAISMPPG